MTNHPRRISWTWIPSLAVAVAVGCGSDDGGSDGGGSGGEGTGAGGSGASSSSGGSSGDGGSSSGGESSGGATGGMAGSSSGGATMAGAAGAANGGTGGSTTECSGMERTCEGNQPRVCEGGRFVDDGPACAKPEVCSEASGTCEASSLEVTGGTFFRSYDTQAGTYDDDGYPATVADFRLDEYEVTVGQFRGFVDAVVAGFRPTAGAGKHTHLNAGSGVANTGGGYEAGWDSDWNDELPSTAMAWNDTLDCSDAFSTTWTASPGANEQKAINCIDWYAAYAYCIWDGGFLPTEAEWNYAAAGGTEQRPYAWGSTAPNSTYLIYQTTSPGEVGSKPSGAGAFGHADLAGNVSEWTLDWHVDSYSTPCDNCAELDPGSLDNRVYRGGFFYTSGSGSLRTGARSYSGPDFDGVGFGVRCARAPE